MNYKEQLERVTTLVHNHMPDKPYHSHEHADEVSRVSGLFARALGLDDHVAHLLRTAGKYHDVIHDGASDCEERSALWGERYLPMCGYSKNDIACMGEMIVHGTKMPRQPITIEEKILADADLYNLGRNYFLHSNEKLRREYGAPADKTWYENSLRFLESVEWYTVPAKAHCEKGRLENIAKLKALLQQLR